jgi:uncharacterized protein VirK/YbjX
MTYLGYLKASKQLHQGHSLRAIRGRLLLGALILSNKAELDAYTQRMTNLLGAQRFELMGNDYIGTLQWPYLSKGWCPKRILNVMASHYETVMRRSSNLLLLERDAKLHLATLSECSENYELVIDRPIWFRREGELVVNLFVEDLRVASLAFTACEEMGKVNVFVGAIQGIHKGIASERSLQIYKEVTKNCYGLRPKSLVIQVTRFLAAAINAENLYVVKDKDRHHRHPYFSNEKASDLGANYDDLWLEHGAFVTHYDDFFELPLVEPRKSVEQIPPRKRSMYRRRYEFLDQLNETIRTSVGAGV